jgi:hypothetical protein
MAGVRTSEMEVTTALPNVFQKLCELIYLRDICHNYFVKSKTVCWPSEAYVQPSVCL